MVWAAILKAHLEIPLAPRPALSHLVTIPASDVEVGVLIEALGHSVGIFAFDSGEAFVDVIDFLLVVLCIG